MSRRSPVICIPSRPVESGAQSPQCRTPPATARASGRQLFPSKLLSCDLRCALLFRTHNPAFFCSNHTLPLHLYTWKTLTEPVPRVRCADSDAARYLDLFLRNYPEVLRPGSYLYGRAPVCTSVCGCCRRAKKNHIISEILRGHHARTVTPRWNQVQRDQHPQHITLRSLDSNSTKYVASVHLLLLKLLPTRHD